MHVQKKEDNDMPVATITQTINNDLSHNTAAKTAKQIIDLCCQSHPPPYYQTLGHTSINSVSPPFQGCAFFAPRRTDIICYMLMSHFQTISIVFIKVLSLKI